MSEGEVRDYRSLGEVLREAREKKGWSLEQLSERTRIVPRMIEALEHDDFGQMSSPVYARGFIRNLAGQLGLDPDWCLSKVDLRDATSAVPETVKRPMPVAPAAVPTAPAPSERGPVWQVESVRVRKIEVESSPAIPWARVGIGLVALALVAAAIWFVPRWIAREPAAGEATNRPPAVEGRLPAAAPDTMDTDTESLDPSPAGDSSTSDDGDGSTGRTGAGDRASTDTKPTDSPSRTAPAPDPPPTPTATPSGEDSRAATPPGGDAANLEAVNSGSAASSLPSVISPDPDRQRAMTLVVRARSRVEVIAAADGQPARQRVLRAGEAWTLEARDHFSLQASDPGAIEADLDGVKRTPPPGWKGDEWLLYPLPEGRGGR